MSSFAGRAPVRSANPGSLSRSPAETVIAVLRRPATLRVLSVTAVLAAWQLVGVSRPYATSYPTAIVRAALRTTTSTVIPAFGDTMEGFWIGLAICIIIGVPLGLLMAQSKLVQLILDPYVTIFYSVPFVALFPILILLAGVSFELRLSVVLLAGLFPIVINTYLGARAVDASLSEVGRAFCARPLQMVRTVIFPGSLPYVFAGIRIGFGRALIAMVIIEIEASSVGIGNLLSQDAQALRIDEYFVPLFYLGFFAILCTYLLRELERWWATPWRRPKVVSSAMAGLARSTPRASSPARGVAASGSAVSALRSDSPTWRMRRLAAPTSVEPGAVAWYAKTAWGRWTVRMLTLLVVLSIWQAYAAHVGAAVLPEPTLVAAAMFRQMFESGAIYGPLFNSCGVLLLGFVASLVVGIPIGVAMGRSRLIEHVVDPYVSWLYGQPHAAFVPLMIVWFGFGLEFRIVYAVFSAVFIVIINTMVGVKNVDTELVDTGRSFCGNERQLLRTVVLPSATPYIVAGARLAFAATWIGVVVAEILSTQSGLGGLMTHYSNYYQLANMMVPIIFIMVISVVILWLTTWSQPRLTPWASTEQTRVRR